MTQTTDRQHRPRRDPRGDTTRRERGYALLLTLVMVALTASAVGTLAHHSGSEALRARQAERDLQSRWAEASSRRVLLPALRDKLNTALTDWRTDDRSTTAMPPTSVTVAFDMLGARVVARLDDQQALPNLNRLLRATGDGQPGDAPGILAGTMHHERLVPQPIDEATARRLGVHPYASWGQLFPGAPPESLSGLDPSGTPVGGVAYRYPDGPAHRTHGPSTTLWGDGKLNLWTASPASLHRVLDETIGSDNVTDLLDLRREHRDLSARQVVQMLNLGPSERAAARLALTDRSEAYAMWVAVQPLEDGAALPGRRARWSLAVVEGNRRASRGRDRVFCW